MTNAEKVDGFLTKAGVFCFLTTDGDQPRGRPFGFHYLDGERIFFLCGSFKHVYAQMKANPRVEVLAVAGDEFLRYDGTVRVAEDETTLQKVKAAMPPRLVEMYERNGWEMVIFNLEDGHAELRKMMELIEAFDL